jgi:formate hydrogenlyase subunit 3/multisubunit Na+/H+ antiporter MnhD subunit
MEKAESTGKDWYRRYWYFCLFPAFVCAAGTQWTLKFPTVITGFVCSLVIVRIAIKIENIWWRSLFILLVPVVLVGFVAFYSFNNSYEPLFYNADINNPYLDNYKNFWRAVIAGIGGLIAVLVGAGATWVFSASNKDRYWYDLLIDRLKKEGDSTNTEER